MPRTVDYPRASLKNAYELANAIDSLGGKCSIQSAADSLGLKISGNFSALVSSTAKYGLIENKGGQVSTTPLFKSIKLSYNEEEKLSFERRAFFSMGVFDKLYETFKGKVLPIPMLSKYLIRELNVEENIATRVKGIFINGLKQLKLLDSENNLIDYKSASSQDKGVETEKKEAADAVTNLMNQADSMDKMSNGNDFSIHIVGPGINSKIRILEEEDFDILEAMIRKIKKRFNSIVE